MSGRWLRKKSLKLKRKQRRKDPIYMLRELVNEIPETPIWGSCMFPTTEKTQDILSSVGKTVQFKRFNPEVN